MIKHLIKQAELDLRDPRKKKWDTLFSSKREDWETPPEIFQPLNQEFHFTLDAAASHQNAKAEHYFTTRSLEESWAFGGSVWLNPPYGRGIGRWVRKASEEARLGSTVVCLLPARTCTKWWHDYIWDRNAPRPSVEVRFLKGRVKFVGAEHAAPFPSVVVVFRPRGSP